MPNVLTFIIPVRHPDNAKDWSMLKHRLGQTLASLGGQTHPDWQAIIVANHGADLPAMPPRVSVAWVDYPPNPLHDTVDDKEAFFEAVRHDKGRRILEGLRKAPTEGHIMLVDDDDFVHRELTAFVAQHPEANGWYVDDGYLWDEGRLLFAYRPFSQFCGTSHIVRADLYRLPPPDDADLRPYIARTLGSHRYIAEDLAAAGTPLAPLPFPGAIYRIGHRGAHSQSQTILRKFFVGAEVEGDLARRIGRLFRLRLLRREHRRDFFGAPS